MISNRITPTAEEVAESRDRLHIPPDWIWGWCANPLCDQWCWYLPGAEVAAKEIGKPFAATCSATCTLAIIQAMP
jgi:hypothetical protein